MTEKETPMKRKERMCFIYTKNIKKKNERKKKHCVVLYVGSIHTLIVCFIYETIPIRSIVDCVS